MSVSVEKDVIRLGPHCAAECAEALIVAIQDDPARIVDVSELVRLHLAAAQILLAAGARVRGKPENPFLNKFLIGPLAERSET